jgi:hypothetical protein
MQYYFRGKQNERKEKDRKMRKYSGNGKPLRELSCSMLLYEGAFWGSWNLWTGCPGEFMVH